MKLKTKHNQCLFNQEMQKKKVIELIQRMFAPKSCLEFEPESKDEDKEINWHCID